MVLSKIRSSLLFLASQFFQVHLQFWIADLENSSPWIKGDLRTFQLWYTLRSRGQFYSCIIPILKSAQALYSICSLCRRRFSLKLTRMDLSRFERRLLLSHFQDQPKSNAKIWCLLKYCSASDLCGRSSSSANSSGLSKFGNYRVSLMRVAALFSGQSSL